jgi:D-alanyl-D-alanine carboxypeptidase
MAKRPSLKELRDYIELFGDRAPLFPPGSRHEYSNYGFILLGRIIEVVSGRSYDAYVRAHVFVPAGMTATDNLPEDSHVEGLAIPYTHEAPHAPPGSAVRSAEDSLPYRGTSAGGGYTTVGDLLKFATALTSHKLLDAQHTDLVVTGKVDTPRRGMQYAYGFEEATLPDGTRRIGHGGGAPGMNGVLSIFPETNYVVVVLANRDPPAAMEIDRFITRQLAPMP